MNVGYYLVGGVMVLLLLLLAVIAFYAIFINPRVHAATDYKSSRYLATPPPPLEQPLILKIVTFNIADGYLFSTNRRERMQAIGALLTALDPDIVGIQESFVASDREVLLDALKGSRLLYHADYPAATVGNGLLTLSAYPIVESYFHRYRASNSWYKLHQGDWWAGKGVGLARIELPGGAQLDFYNTHAQAGRRDDANLQVKYEQMGELAAFINQSRSGTAPTFVVGDFNTKIGRADLQHAIDEAKLVPMVSMDTGIDLILTVDDPHYHTQIRETLPIEGVTQGSNAAVFLSRAPGLRELWNMHFGEGQETPLSDHRGYLSAITVESAGSTT